MKSKPKKQIGDLKSLDFYGKKDELKKNEGIFPQNYINDLIWVKLKEILKLQDIIEKVI